MTALIDNVTGHHLNAVAIIEMNQVPCLLFREKYKDPIRLIAVLLRIVGGRASIDESYFPEKKWKEKRGKPRWCDGKCLCSCRLAYQSLWHKGGLRVEGWACCYLRYLMIKATQSSQSYSISLTMICCVSLYILQDMSFIAQSVFSLGRGRGCNSSCEA